MAGRGGFARELCTKSAREGPSNGGHFGNSGLYRLRNHGTSDGRTWTTPRAAASCVALATSQGRAGAVGDVHKALNLFLGPSLVYVSHTVRY